MKAGAPGPPDRNTERRLNPFVAQDQSYLRRASSLVLIYTLRRTVRFCRDPSCCRGRCGYRGRRIAGH